MVQLVCANRDCGKTFEKSTGEYNRCERKGKPHYCSLGCAAAEGNRKVPRGNPPPPRKQADEFTGFRYFLRVLKRRGSPSEWDKKHKRDRTHGPTTLTLKDLREQWDKQGGKCQYTGWHLNLPGNLGFIEPRNLRNASVDRIDNSKGYVKDNIQFVAVIANLAKWTFTDSELFEFCEAVTRRKQRTEHE